MQKTHVLGLKQGGFEGDGRRKGRCRPREQPGIYRETDREYTEKPTGNLIKYPKNMSKMPRNSFLGWVFGGFGEVSSGFLGRK